MRLLFNRCHGENPKSPAPAESGEPCEFVELEFFIDGPCESCTSTAQQGWIVVFHHLAVWFWGDQPLRHETAGNFSCGSPAVACNVVSHSTVSEFSFARPAGRFKIHRAPAMRPET